ncbi:MAG: hypothetical protein GY936_04065 [Ignavibacteriae bacterium]|nr:hypothetical protein [Ignavibacteriota bacterium]
MNDQIINQMEQDMQLLGLFPRTQETYLYREKRLLNISTNHPKKSPMKNYMKLSP